jgi:hypothetical protein
LDDLIISDLGEFNIFQSAQAQDVVPVGSSIESDLVVLGSFPVVVQSTEPFVDSQVVKGNVRNDFLFKG